MKKYPPSAAAIIVSLMGNLSDREAIKNNSIDDLSTRDGPLWTYLTPMSGQYRLRRSACTGKANLVIFEGPYWVDRRNNTTK